MSFAKNALSVLSLLILVSMPSFGQLLSGTRIESDTSAGAKLCLEELYTNGSSAVCIQAPSSIASEYTLTFPAALPGATSCVEVSTSGVISFTGSACGSGGGSGITVEDDDSSPSYSSSTTIRFDQDDGFVLSNPGANIAQIDLTISPSGTPVGTGRTISTTTPLGGGGALSSNLTLTCSTCVTTNTTQTITGAKTFQNTITARSILPETDTTYVLGSSSVAWDDIFSDRYDIVDAGGGTGSWSMVAQANAVNSYLTISDSGPTVFVTFSQKLFSSTTNRALFSADVWPNIDSTYDLGGPSNYWANLYVDAGVIPSLTVSTYGDITIGSGNFYIRDVGGASTGISCSGVGDGWMGITTDNYIVWCNGSTRYRATGASY